MNAELIQAWGAVLSALTWPIAIVIIVLILRDPVWSAIAKGGASGRRMSSMRNLILACSIIAALSILGIILIAILNPTARSDISIELAKLLMQLVVIAIIGGIISLLIGEFNRQRQKLEALNDLRKTLLDRLIRAYSGTKESRRLLRANDSLAFYDQQMKIINRTQLDLETIVQEVETAKYAFSHPEPLKSNIETMADYLNGIVKEYEQEGTKLSREPESSVARPEDLEQLEKFLAKAKAKVSEFRPAFADPFSEALKLIRADILEG